MNITEAKQLTYSHNPIVIKAESDTLPTFDGSIFSANFSFPYNGVGGDFGIGNAIIFDGVRFVSVASEQEEDETSFFLNSNVDNFIDTFNSNSDVNKKYVVIKTSIVEMVIKALNKGTAFNTVVLVENTNLPHLGNVSILEGTDSYYGDTKTDYGVFLEVYEGRVSDFLNITTPEKNNFTKKADLLINYRIDNIYEFNLSGILRAYLGRDIPNATITSVHRVGDQIGYYTRIGEVYKVNDTYRKRAFNLETDTAAVMLGAVDLLEENNALIHTTGTPLVEANLKPIYRDKGEYFYSFLKGVIGLAGTIWVRATIFFYDGTSDFFLIGQMRLDAQNGVYYIKFNTDSLGLSSLEATKGARAEYMAIDVFDSVNGGYAAPVTYKFFDCPKELINIGFRNKYGVIDTYSFVGKKEEETKGKIRTYNAFYPLTQSKTDRNLAILTNEQRKIFTYNSGHLNESEFNSLLDLIKSTEVYILENGEFTYIVPTGYEYSFNSDTYLYTVSLKAVRTILENSL